MRHTFFIFFALLILKVQLLQSMSCGKAEIPLIGGRIIGGRVAEREEFPWMVSLQRLNNPILKFAGIRSHRDDYTHFCGGSLIADSWVLTAAHCFDESFPLKDVRVIAGLHSLSKKTPEESIHRIQAVIKHPYLDQSEFVNDICLIKLRTPVKLRFPITNTVCLPRPSYTPQGSATIAGWGHTSVNGRNSDRLMSLDMPIIARKKCQLIYGRKTIREEMLCAGYLKGGKDACNTDSGGPLMQLHGSAYTILGVISFGLGDSCGAPDAVTVFTRVSTFVPWIFKAINAFDSHNRTIRRSSIRRIRNTSNVTLLFTRH